MNILRKACYEYPSQLLETIQSVSKDIQEGKIKKDTWEKVACVALKTIALSVLIAGVVSFGGGIVGGILAGKAMTGFGALKLTLGALSTLLTFHTFAVIGQNCYDQTTGLGKVSAKAKDTQLFLKKFWNGSKNLCSNLLGKKNEDQAFQDFSEENAKLEVKGFQERYLKHTILALF